jgi:hypothetical protein
MKPAKMLPLLAFSIVNLLSVGVAVAEDDVISVVPSVESGMSCIQLSDAAISAQFMVSGSATISFSGFSGSGRLGSTASTSGKNYKRINAAGDMIDLYLDGKPGESGTFSAAVTLSEQTIRTIQYYGGCVMGVQFNNTGLTVGSPGIMYGGVSIVVASHGISWVLPASFVQPGADGARILNDNGAARKIETKFVPVAAPAALSAGSAI